jgi:ABC-type Fe3+ transport system substrate-binding protein
VNLRWLAAVPPLLLLALPLVLRETRPAPAGAVERLVILTPHTETIREEFGRAFAAWARRELRREVDVDWRSPGGTSDIVKLVDEQFAAAFATAHPDLPAAARKAFADARVDPADTRQPAAAREARRRFLASELGIGADLMFGGGEFDHRVSLADKGYVVDVGILQAMPEVFRDEVVPQTLAGETIWDRRGRYVGTALSSFGIVANPDRLAALGLALPATWEDLAAPGLLGAVEMADPSKSGSVATCYVMMIQERMQRAVAAAGGAGPDALDAGWRDGLLLIRRMAGNARHVTDSASRVPRDVGHGDAAAGMSIDFYGRAEAEWTRAQSGRERVVFAVPVAGTSISADPISCFRGAPHRDLALAFMRFVLSPDGQRLWNYRVGEPGGPQRHALRRWPVRRDLYGAEHRGHMSDPGDDPFALAAGFTLQPAWTGAYFDLIRTTIKATALDPRPELEEAWRAILAAGGPAAVPQALAEFAWLPYAHHEAPAAKEALAKDRVGTTRRWCIAAQEHYRAARRLAGERR